MCNHRKMETPLLVGTNTKEEWTIGLGRGLCSLSALLVISPMSF